jgi:hypothetical protein
MSKHIVYKSTNEPSKHITGSGLSGYFKCSRAHLEACFGPPLDRKYVDEYKTSYEWHIEIEHDGEFSGAVAIYDYKSDHSDDIGEEIHWHLGSKQKQHAEQLVEWVSNGTQQLI